MIRRNPRMDTYVLFIFKIKSLLQDIYAHTKIIAYIKIEYLSLCVNNSAVRFTKQKIVIV